MHNNNNYQCIMCWNKALTFGFGSIQLSFHPIHAKVFSIQMLLYTFQSNCAEGLHFSAFHFGLYYYPAQNGNLMDLLLHIHIYLYTHIGFITTYILIYTYIIIQYNIYYSVYSTSQVVACALSLPLRMFFI